MKRSKPASSKQPSPCPADSRAGLAELQRAMARALFRPLNPQWGMQPRTEEGRSMHEVAAEFIKPGANLTSFERLEIYNRQYWYRLLDCLHDDYPGVRAVLGPRRFLKMATAYLVRYPSRSHSLRDLGNRLATFLGSLRRDPAWAGPRLDLACEMARFEWAQVVAFDGPAVPALTPDDLLDVAPAGLRLSLQPYLTLLELRFGVDELAVAIKHEEALRSEASQAVDSHAARRNAPAARVRLPKVPRKRIWLAVHRCDNVVYVKRLEKEAFVLLKSLHRGLTVEEACLKAVAASRTNETDWPAQIGAWFDAWSQLGWFSPRRKRILLEMNG